MEITAEDFLAEIPQETLQDLLLSIRHNMVDVDQLLQGGRDGAPDTTKDDEHGMNQLLARGNVVELQGASGTGKTRLVYEAVSSCILPGRSSDVEFGGWGQAAFVLDTDDTFDILCLARMLRRKINKIISLHTTNQPQDHMDRIRDDVLQEALRNLHVFQPSSSVQLAATILQLPHYHYDEAHTQHREFGLLVVDSLSPFYWQDRFTTEQLRGGQSNARTPFRHVLTALEQVRRTHRPAILLTNWGLNPLVKDPTVAESSPFFRQHLYPMSHGFEVSLPNHTTHDIGSRQTIAGFSRRATPAHIAPEHEPIEAASRNLSTLSLTHHVTLSRDSAVETISEFGPAESQALTLQTHPSEFVGLVRVPNHKMVGQFRFIVHDAHIDFYPGDVFRR